MPSSTNNEKRTAVRGLGEIALRVNNLDAMQKFYEEVIGLPLMARDSNCAFFKIAEATAVTPKCWPCSTAHGAPAIAGRTLQLDSILSDRNIRQNLDLLCEPSVDLTDDLKPSHPSRL
jgi:hypothetical protein